MILSLLDIIENTGKTMTVPVRPSFTGVTVNGKTFPVTIASAAVFTITNTGKKVLSVEAEGTVTATIPCDRCLKEVQVQIPWKVEQKLDCRLTEEDRQKALDEQSYLEGTNLDVDRMVYLEVLMNWPLKVLCKEDCKGICSQCGKDLNLGPCGCKSEPKDPRMAAISDIFSKYKEV